MPYPFTQLPTLRKFIDCAIRLGFEEVHSQEPLTGPKGTERFHYLKHPGPPKKYVILPDIPEEAVLTLVTLANLCRRIDIPPSEFGLELDFLEDPFPPPAGRE